MSELILHSESFSPTGNLASEGALNQLGRPKLDLLGVLVREAVQNSWDARSAGGNPIDVEFALRTFDAKQWRALRGEVFKKLPPGLPLDGYINGALPGRVLCISDRGTEGLGGPTRADQDAGTEPLNFVNLLRNIGLPPQRPLGGGTYGYGKVALFLASKVSTVCAYSHSTHAGMSVSRFMAAGLGNGYSSRGLRYTGRHWWGHKQGSIVDPVQGKESDALARRLGLPEIEKDQTGTTIAIFDPRLDDDDDACMKRLVEHLLWNFWPKMLPGSGGQPAIRFTVKLEDRDVNVPTPFEFLPLKGFVKAMAKLKNNPSETVGIACERPRQSLGRLSLEMFPAQPVEPGTDSDDDDVSINIPRRGCHHVALMRQVELIVKYLPGPKLPTSGLEYAGVFIADKAVDPVFAKSEPPTHDDWSCEMLESRTERSFVRVALKRINEALKDFTAEQGTGTGGAASEVPLGGFADELGDLLIGHHGPSGRAQPTGRGGGGGGGGGRGGGGRGGGRGRGTRKATVEILETRVEERNGKPIVIVSFVPRHAPGSKTTIISATFGAVLDGSELERDPPFNASVPQVLEWRDMDGVAHKTTNLEVPASTEKKCSITLLAVPDALLGVELAARSGSKS